VYVVLEVTHPMTRVQILLPEDEDRALERLARRRRESKSSLVRRAVSLLFRLEAVQGEPLLGLIGQAGKAGGRRGARDHDRILVRAARRQGSR
jgi:Arc/MetJ-type ribon-helix-helix transcriptional regulator